MKWRSLAETESQTDQRALREVFAERKDLIAKYVPADVQAVHEGTVATLKQQRLAAKLSLSVRTLCRSNFPTTMASSFPPPHC